MDARSSAVGGGEPRRGRMPPRRRGSGRSAAPASAAASQPAETRQEGGGGGSLRWCPSARQARGGGGAEARRGRPPRAIRADRSGLGSGTAAALHRYRPPVRPGGLRLPAALRRRCRCLPSARRSLRGWRASLEPCVLARARPWQAVLGAPPTGGSFAAAGSVSRGKPEPEPDPDPDPDLTAGQTAPSLAEVLADGVRAGLLNRQEAVSMLPVLALRVPRRAAWTCAPRQARRPCSSSRPCPPVTPPTAAAAADDDDDEDEDEDSGGGGGGEAVRWWRRWAW